MKQKKRENPGRLFYPFVLMLFMAISMSSCGEELKVSEEQLKNPDRLLDRGREYYILEEYDLAIEVFEMVIKRFPKRSYSAAWAQYEIGMSHYICKRYEKAVAAFKKVLNNYVLPKQPRILAIRLIRKINNKHAYRRSTYIE